MKTRSEIAVLFEAEAVAREAITGALALHRVQNLCLRLEAAGDDHAGLVAAARRLADALPRHRWEADQMIDLARALRDGVHALLRPAPVGLERRDIHG
jgi:hypothetical protein